MIDIDYIRTLANEWYCTEQELVASIMEEFRSYIEPKQQKKQNNV